jgi:Ala-tRNA(Pro) deacylase
MTTLQKTLEHLDRARIPYEHTTHAVAYTARDVAAAEHVSPHSLAKVVVYFGDAGYGMAVVPADCVVDLEELRKALNLKTVRLATEAEIGALFPDSELGAMPPFGTLFDLPVIMDEGLRKEPRIAFNAGTHRDVIHMNLADFVALTRPVEAAIGRIVMTAR